MLAGEKLGVIVARLVVLTCLLLACTSPATPTPRNTPAPTDAPTATAAHTESPTARVPAVTKASPPVIQLPPAGASEKLSTPLSSSAVAVAPYGSVVAAVNPDSDSVTLVDPRSLEVIQEVPVGDDPRTVAFTPDSRLALVANHGSASITLINMANLEEVTHISVGPMPYGVVTDGQLAFVSYLGPGNVGVIDLEKKTVVQRIPTSPFPAGLAIRPAEDKEGQGPLLLVTHLFTGGVTVIDLKDLSIRTEASTGVDTNLSQSITVSPDMLKAYLPQTRSNVTNLSMTFDTTVFPVVNVLDLTELAVLPRERITLDTADQPVNMPFAAVSSPDGARLYVVNAGSNDLSVMDLNTRQSQAHLQVGANPRGIVITPDGARLFVNNVLDGTLSVIDANALKIIGTVPTTNIPLPAEVLLGKQIFSSSDSPALTTDRWISCATCHFDGGMDARTWLGFPDGPRNTPAIFGAAQTLPLHWSGDLDELQDVELTIRDIQFGTGLVPGEAYDSLEQSHSGRSRELDALAAYMALLEVPSSPFSADQEAIQRGKSKFAALGCQSCHTPPRYTNARLHDVGTGDPNKEKNSHGRETNFDTPSLLGVWSTAPYLHDGSAATLEDVFQSGTVHDLRNKVTPEELEDLVAFLRSLPNRN